MLEWLLSALDAAWLFALHLAGKSSFPGPLSPEEEQACIEQMGRGEPQAKEKLIVHNLRLVAHIAKKYASSRTDGDDLVSIGTIGLMKAVNTFRPESGKLTSYASRCIENEILMHLRSEKKRRNTVSLNDPIGADSDGNEVRLMDLLDAGDEGVDEKVERRVEARRALEALEGRLEPREKQVILLRYALADGVQRPQHEVGKILGISRSYVSRIEKQALEKIRRAMEEEAGNGPGNVVK
ncbi:MAG: RNA polymerase sporulation sigma factor SigK [Eubacteriales bacterium]|nr:RNA polymerase sporulation sigma factor SigK [Clostridiales bacterium]MDD6931568.1 RNA polymerase sporulation sigma factor SigK [Eubacteriales bacterium]MDO4387594.1 RNA polymerase sporulation sigma factor SigK [Eubacteriales bacterium]MDY2600590.1 RNA polymerase sporulation sigma factor SigK [Eubacteriales bacterium]